MSEARQLKVCIIGLKCYDHLVGKPVPRYLGGIETQLAVLAKGLAAEGCEVTVITFGQGPCEIIPSGVRLIKAFNPESGVPILRFLFQTIKLWRAMSDADADIYLQMGAGSETGQAAICARRMKRYFVFCMASDANYGAHLGAGVWAWEGRLYQCGLRQADLIVAQTKKQRRGLLETVGLESIIIPMAVAARSYALKREAGNRVLWIGRITREKRLEWLLEIARLCPRIQFDLVGTPNRKSTYAEALLDEARSVPNVFVHGRVSDAKLQSLFETAGLLCCTSNLEGFPTTFLEAWSHGLPVVTTIDPDNVIESNGLGYFATNVETAARAIEAIISETCSNSSRRDAVNRYFFDNHAIAGVARRFQETFVQLVNARNARNAPAHKV